MFMKAEQLGFKSGHPDRNRKLLKISTLRCRWSTDDEISRITDEPTMCMKAQQLNADAGTLSESQVTQNKHLTMPSVGRSAKEKRY
jgi:hypothetical protein